MSADPRDAGDAARREAVVIDSDDTVGPAGQVQDIAFRRGISPRDGGVIVWVGAHTQVAFGPGVTGDVTLIALSEAVDGNAEPWVMLSPDEAIGLAVQLLAVAQRVRGGR